MNTATITWVYFNNYGTMLQAYALQSYLHKNGISNDIIYDEAIIKEIQLRISRKKNINENETDNKYKDTIESLRAVRKKIYRIIKLIFSRQGRKKRRESIQENKRQEKTFNLYRLTQQKYQVFKETELKIRYDVIRQTLDGLNNEYDCFICGSDQIWSVIERNFDGYFFLDFAKKKKLAYAVSIGTDNIPFEKLTKIKRYINDFDLVTVREKSTAEKLSTLIGREVRCVCDPTLLLTKEEWGELGSKSNISERNYLLCYFIGNNNWYFEYAEKLSAILNLKIIMITANYNLYDSKYICDKPVGPIEFIELIKKADFVLTDSYHGSIFSIIFEKQMLHLKRFKDDDTECQNNRIYSLFNILNINELIVEEKQFSSDDIKNIDYNSLNSKIDNFKKTSERILLEALRGQRNEYQ